MLPAVRDGNADAIHDARVATRRLRAAAPLAWAFEPEDRWAEPMEALRTLSRSFGRARDLDVALERLTSIEGEGRLTPSARTLAYLKQTLTERQGRAHRTLIKTIEGLPLDSIRGLRLDCPRLTMGRDRRPRVLEKHLAERATDLREAIDRASGVYFPNRAHQVRVNVKKLRYLLELLPKRARPAGALKSLRRAQESLGEVHDQQSLIDQIEDVKASSTDRDQFDPVLALLAADRRDAFSDYVGQRERLQHLASDIVRSYDSQVSPRQILTRALLMAGVVMAPSAAALIARQRGRFAAGQPPVAGTGFGRTPAAEPDRPAGDRRSAALITAARR
jgi:CHAD domain-containing protein